MQNKSMAFFYLTSEFYEKYKNCKEILQKQKRPYAVHLIRYNNLTFAIPVRSNINHNFSYKTIGSKGLDFTKTVIITDEKYLSDNKAVINHEEYLKLDKNRKFINRKLCDLSSLKKIPEFSYPEIIKRSSTIDVIWFDNRLFDDNEIKLPHSFFEVEHSTDIQNSLLKYNDLQNFYTEMFIVADEVRKQEFEKKISYSAFRELKENNRVKFLSYDRLVELYEITKKNLQGIIL